MILDEQDSFFPNSILTSPETINEIPTKSYVQSLHETNKNRRELSLVFNDQDKEFDNIKLTKLDGVTVYREPISGNDLSTKKHIDVSIGKGTLENYLKVSVGNGT